MKVEKNTRELVIDPELQSLLPPLPQDVFAWLEADILKHGCLMPIIVWNDTIVDGHWRYAICKKHGLPFNVRNKEFESVEGAMHWMYKNQCENQRNLDQPETEKRTEFVDFNDIMSDVLKLDPRVIRTDLGTQVRVGLNREAIDDYASAMRRGDEFPAILVFYDRSNDEYILVDGFHRYFSHQIAKPNEPILVKRQYGNRESARWAAIGANKRNSVRRTNEDKRRAVEWALLHACGAKMSNRQIAGHVGVDEVTVRRARARLESTATLPQSSERIGRDGRTIDTSRIGKTRDRRHPKENEDGLAVSLKTLLDRFEHGNAESFLVGAVDIFRNHHALDHEAAEGILRQLGQAR